MESNDFDGPVGPHGNVGSGDTYGSVGIDSWSLLHVVAPIHADGSDESIGSHGSVGSSMSG